MSWQEDLQQLDNALASGKITADEYRQRRDQALASAAGALQPQPGQPPQGQPQPGQQPMGQPPLGQPQPGQQPEPGSPFPPPFKWGGGADATQAVRQPEPDRTQVVRPGATPVPDAERTQYVQPVSAPRPDAERTQVVPQGPGSGGFPQQQPPQDWSGGAAAPPWGSGDFGTGGAWNAATGPEVFEEEPSGGKGKIIAVVLVVVLVVGLGFGAYMIWGRGPSTPVATDTTTPSTTTVTTTTPPKRTPDGPFVELEGKLNQFKTLPVDDAVTAKLPTLEEAQLVKQGGATEVRYVVSRDEATNLVQGIWAFKAAQPDGLLTTVDGLYAAANFQRVTDVPTGVIARHLPLTDQNALSTYRAHYVVDDFVVRVEAYGPDEAAAKAAFDELLERQLAEHPPTS